MDPNSPVYDEALDYQDVKLKIIQQEGYDAHDFHLFDDRASLLWRKPYVDGAVRELTAGDSGKSTEQIRQAVEQLMFEAGNHNPNVRAIQNSAQRARSNIRVDADVDHTEALLKDMRRNPEKYEEYQGEAEPMGCSGAELGSSPRCPDAVDFERRLRERVVGQDEAIDKVTWMVQTFMAGFNPPNRPAGILLFLGPTGLSALRTSVKPGPYLPPHPSPPLPFTAIGIPVSQSKWLEGNRVASTKLQQDSRKPSTENFFLYTPLALPAWSCSFKMGPGKDWKFTFRFWTIVGFGPKSLF